MAPRRFRILVCRGPECGEKRGSARVRAALAAHLEAHPVAGVEVTVDGYCCFGLCQRGPNVLVRALTKDETAAFAATIPVTSECAFYHGVTPDDAARILDEHVADGRVQVDLKRRNPV